jgi:hypothetical protein
MMATSEITKIKTEMNKRRIRPILNRILKRNNLTLLSDKQDDLLTLILSELDPEQIMDDSDKALYFQIIQLMGKEPVSSLLESATGQHFSKKLSNYDIRHKEAIRHCLPEFFDLFFPDIVDHMKFDTVQFLDKELISFLADANIEDQLKIVDTLIMIDIDWNQINERIMIHWEIQGTKQPLFNERMFHLFCGIYFQFRKRILPIAMFIDPHQWTRPISETFNMSIMNYPVINAFTYQLIKLKQYSAEEFEQLKPDNPLTYAYLPLTYYPKEQKHVIKARSINGMIKTVKNEKQKAVIYSLIDKSLPLTQEEHEKYEQLLELNDYKEVKMFETVEEYMEEKYTEKGIEKGRAGIITQIIKSGMMTIDQIVQATGEQYEYVKNMFQAVQQEAAC